MRSQRALECSRAGEQCDPLKFFSPVCCRSKTELASSVKQGITHPDLHVHKIIIIIILLLLLIIEFINVKFPECLCIIQFIVLYLLLHYSTQLLSKLFIIKVAKCLIIIV